MRRWLSWGMGCVLLTVAARAETPRITAFERSQGWRLLFDGESLAGWHSFGASRVAANWTVHEGAIITKEDGTALVTDMAFRDFELTFLWRVAEGGRAEVYFRLAEDEDSPARTGPVFELAGPGTESGGSGGLIRPEVRVEPRPGAWQSGRLVVVGDLVEYWIAGQRISAYELDGAAWRAALTGSKYAGFRDYGRLRVGPLALAGRGAEFRNLKIRAL